MPTNINPLVTHDQNNKSKEKKSRSTNVTEEKRRIQNANYNRKRREILRRPENAEKLKIYKQKRSKANAAYRKRLVSDGNSGLASEQRLQTYLKHLERVELDKRRNLILRNSQIVNNHELLDAVGTPDWDEILADGLDMGVINSPERENAESRSADNPIQQPSMAETITKKNKRVLSQDPQLIARRKREMQWKQDNPLLYKQRAEIKAQKRRERRALQPKLIRIKKDRKPNKERYYKMMKNLKVDGNQAKLQNFRNRRSNENKRYFAKLKEEVEDGTATEERRRIYERRIRPAKRRKKFSLPQQHQNSQNDPKDNI